MMMAITPDGLEAISHNRSQGAFVMVRRGEGERGGEGREGEGRTREEWDARGGVGGGMGWEEGWAYSALYL